MMQLIPVQQAILDVVGHYPGQFSRSGLAKMLVGAKSWQEKEFPDYGRFAQYRRKEIGFQVDVLLQQGYLDLDGHSCLVPTTTGTGNR